MSSPIKGILTTDEAAEYLGLSSVTVCLYCRNGRIKAKRVGTNWLMAKRDLETFRKKPRRVGNPNFGKKT